MESNSTVRANAMTAIGSIQAVSPGVPSTSQDVEVLSETAKAARMDLTGRRQLIAENRKKGHAIRRRSRIAQALSFGLCLAATAILSVSLALCAGFLQSNIDFLRFDVETRVAILFYESIYLLIFLFFLWLLAVFLDGWHYDTLHPVQARRGKAKGWYDAMTDALTEQEATVASGISRAINLSLRAKVKSSHLNMWSLFIVSLGITIFFTTMWNLATTPEFMERAQLLLLSSIQSFRGAFVSVVGGSISGSITLPDYVSFVLFLLPSALATGVGVMLRSKAETINFALLSTPDILRRFIYYFKHKQNKGITNYTDKDAISDAYRALLHFGLKSAPDDFYGRDDEVFFFDEETRLEFKEYMGLKEG